jgi:SAM-dependent methyltransferase
MRNYDSTTYGERSAADYDDLLDGGGSAAPTVAFLTGLLPEGEVLELGVGTGRVAIPLAQQGLKVTGIDSSPAMLAQMAGKPGGSAVEPVLGDLAEPPADRAFDLVYVLCSTLFFLRSQERQVHCFENVAAALRPGGAFVVEASLPPYRRMNDRQYVDAFQVDADEVAFFLSLHDPLAQRVDRQEIALSERRTRLVPISYRYSSPSELDLMARIAGLTLESRHGGWTGEDVTATSYPVTVYRKARA